MSYILRIKLRYETEFLYATNKSIGLGLTYLSMHEILKIINQEYIQNLTWLSFLDFFMKLHYFNT